MKMLTSASDVYINSGVAVSPTARVVSCLPPLSFSMKMNICDYSVMIYYVAVFVC